MIRGRDGNLSRAAEFGIYLAAAAIYIAVGFVRKEVFAWWIYGAAWFVACAWFAPIAVYKVRTLGRPANGCIQAPPEEKDPPRE